MCCTAVEELGSELEMSRLELEMSRLEEVSGNRRDNAGPTIEEPGRVEARFDLALGRHDHFCLMGL